MRILTLDECNQALLRQVKKSRKKDHENIRKTKPRRKRNRNYLKPIKISDEDSIFRVKDGGCDGIFIRYKKTEYSRG